MECTTLRNAGPGVLGKVDDRKRYQCLRVRFGFGFSKVLIGNVDSDILNERSLQGGDSGRDAIESCRITSLLNIATVEVQMGVPVEGKL